MTKPKAVVEAPPIRPFHVNVPDEDLTELRRRINATRWPERETVTDKSQGVQLATIQALARYWATTYDWRKVEARLKASVRCANSRCWCMARSRMGRRGSVESPAAVAVQTLRYRVPPGGNPAARGAARQRPGCGGGYGGGTGGGARVKSGFVFPIPPTG